MASTVWEIRGIHVKKNVFGNLKNLMFFGRVRVVAEKQQNPVF